MPVGHSTHRPSPRRTRLNSSSPRRTFGAPRGCLAIGVSRSLAAPPRCRFGPRSTRRARSEGARRLRLLLPCLDDRSILAADQVCSFGRHQTPSAPPHTTQRAAWSAGARPWRASASRDRCTVGADSRHPPSTKLVLASSREGFVPVCEFWIATRGSAAPNPVQEVLLRNVGVRDRQPLRATTRNSRGGRRRSWPRGGPWGGRRGRWIVAPGLIAGRRGQVSERDGCRLKRGRAF
jgi:hypothetical protein